MMRDPGQFELSGRWRRIVALLAAVAWVFALTVCPEAPEAVAAATQSSIHSARADHESGHSDHHAACLRAAHASAVLHFAKAVRTGGAFAASVPPGAAVTQPVFVVSVDSVVAVRRAIDERLRPRSARFAGFWPHAPPLSL